MQNQSVVSHFKQEIATLMGASSLDVVPAAPSDATNYTSMAVDDSTFLYMRLSVCAALLCPQGLAQCH